MTVSKLIKQLQRHEAAGHGRCAVVVNKKSLFDYGGDATVCYVDSVEIEAFQVLTDDGVTRINRDGNERFRTTCVLKGEL